MRKDYDFGIVGRVERDEDPSSPRDWDNLGLMVCNHARHNLGDTQDQPEAVNDGSHIVLPLYLYDHSGITMATTPFNCGWDSGTVGIIYAKKGAEGLTDEKIKAVLEGEVESYDNFLTGNVWGFVIENSQGDALDSCWGFIGEKDHCESEMEEQAKYFVAEIKAKITQEQIEEVGEWSM